MPKSDPASIFVVADQYRAAGTWLVTSSQYGYPFDVQMPLVTCYALSLELYFKSLLTAEGIFFPNTHDLKKLFGKLPRQIQARIRDFSIPFMDRKFQAMIEEDYRQNGLAAPVVDFDFLLRASRHAFPVFRYIYETGLARGTGWLANPIIESARKVILDMHPDWKDYHQKTPVTVLQTRPMPPTR